MSCAWLSCRGSCRCIPNHGLRVVRDCTRTSWSSFRFWVLADLAQCFGCPKAPLCSSHGWCSWLLWCMVRSLFAVAFILWPVALGVDALGYLRLGALTATRLSVALTACLILQRMPNTLFGTDSHQSLSGICDILQPTLVSPMAAGSGQSTLFI
jgi:hypothetical protein